MSDKPTGAAFGKSSGTSSYTTRRTDHPDKNRDRLYRAVQTPSSNFKEVLKERFVASLFETVERDCGNEYWATRDSPATHAAVSPLPCRTFGNTKSGKVYRLAAWFLPVVPDTIPQTVANPSIQRFEFPVYRSLFEVVQPSTYQQV